MFPHIPDGESSWEGGGGGGFSSKGFFAHLVCMLVIEKNNNHSASFHLALALATAAVITVMASRT